MTTNGGEMVSKEHYPFVLEGWVHQLPAVPDDPDARDRIIELHDLALYEGDLDAGRELQRLADSSKPDAAFFAASAAIWDILVQHAEDDPKLRAQLDAALLDLRRKVARQLNQDVALLAKLVADLPEYQRHLLHEDLVRDLREHDPARYAKLPPELTADVSESWVQ